MRLPRPPERYDARDQSETRVQLERADDANHKRGADVEIGAARLILRAPDGTRYSITVSNTGTLSAVAV